MAQITTAHHLSIRSMSFASYAQDTITAKISKTFSEVLGKFTDAEGIVSCYLEATDEAWTSEAGQKVLQHKLCVMGESEFCGDQ